MSGGLSSGSVTESRLVDTTSPALLFERLSGRGSGGATATTTIANVIVHPLVILHVLDHHNRRQEESGRVIGTLLGRRYGSVGGGGGKSSGGSGGSGSAAAAAAAAAAGKGSGETIEITNCFAVPHAERGEEVAIGKDYNRRMLSLHNRLNKKESVVGWYASSSESPAAAAAAASPPPSLIAETSSLIHEFYAGESDDGDPIHVVVDTAIRKSRPGGRGISIRAYKSTPIIVQGESLGNLFHELRVSLRSNEPETICLQQMIQQQEKSSEEDGAGAADTNGNTKEGGAEEEQDTALALQASMEKLHELLEATLKYVDSVVEKGEGADPGSTEIGRQISDTLATVPNIRPEVFDRLFHDSLQDLLMVTYLSNITRTQVIVAEKLNAILGI